jgi:hypothetical protein
MIRKINQTKEAGILKVFRTAS